MRLRSHFVASSAILSLVAGLGLLGCEAPIPEPDVPPGPDVPEPGCHTATGSLQLHAAMDTLVLDYGATAIWAFEQDSVIWLGDFPQDGILAQREYTLHRQGFPQPYTLCLPPGRYLIRAIIDLNHNGWVCETGELWGSIEDYVHPPATGDELTLVLDSVISDADGCLGEQTIPSSDNL